MLAPCPHRRAHAHARAHTPRACSLSASSQWRRRDVPQTHRPARILRPRTRARAHAHASARAHTCTRARPHSRTHVTRSRLAGARTPATRIHLPTPTPCFPPHNSSLGVAGAIVPGASSARARANVRECVRPCACACARTCLRLYARARNGSRRSRRCARARMRVLARQLCSVRWCRACARGGACAPACVRATCAAKLAQ
jgi:hypothetical protein